jgi:hypothetical protein
VKHKSRGGADKQVVARLSDLGYELLKEVSHHWGQTFTGTVELLLRLEAERRGILVGGEIVKRSRGSAPPTPPASAPDPLHPLTAAPALPGPAETALFGLPDALSGLPVVMPDAPRQSLVTSLKSVDARFESGDL